MDARERKRRLRVARANAEITSHAELARQIKSQGIAPKGYSKAVVEAIENGRHMKTTEDDYRVIARACNVPLRYLIDETFDPLTSQAEDDDQSLPVPAHPPKAPRLGGQSKSSKDRRQAGS